MPSTRTMNMALPEPLRADMAERVAAGHDGSTSEHVRELIRRNQRDQVVWCPAAPPDMQRGQVARL